MRSVKYFAEYWIFEEVSNFTLKFKLFIVTADPISKSDDHNLINDNS